MKVSAVATPRFAQPSPQRQLAIAAGAPATAVCLLIGLCSVSPALAHTTVAFPVCPARR